MPYTKPGPKAPRPPRVKAGEKARAQRWGATRSHSAFAVLRGPPACLQWAHPGQVYSGDKSKKVRWRYPRPRRANVRAPHRAVEGSPMPVPTGSQSRDQLGWRGWGGALAGRQEPGKQGCGRGAVASPALSTSLTQAGPAVPAGLFPERLGPGVRHTPCTALCSTRTRAHPFREACPRLGERRALGRNHASSGKRESIAERPGPA